MAIHVLLTISWVYPPVKKFPKNCIWTAISLTGNYESYWYISWKKITEFGFTRVPTLPTIHLVYLKSFVFRKNQNFQRTKYVRHFWVFVLSYRPIWKDGNGGKFRRPYFSSKRIAEMLFHESELILKTMKVTWYNSLFGSFLEFGFLKPFKWYI